MNAAAELVDRARTSRIRRALRGQARPHRLGVLLDCSGLRGTSREPQDPASGYGVGAGHAGELLRWCEDWGIAHLAVHVVVADVLRRREAAQVGYAQGLVDAIIAETVAGAGERWRVEATGELSRLPASTLTALRVADSWTRGRASEVTVSIGHPGQQPGARLGAANVLLTPPTPTCLAERDLAEALLTWLRRGAGRASWG